MPDKSSPHCLLFNVHFNIVFPPTPTLSKCSQSFGFSHKNYVCIHRFPMLHPSKRFDLTLLIIFCSEYNLHAIKYYRTFSTLLQLVLLSSKPQVLYSAPFSRVPTMHVLESVHKTSFHSQTKQQQNCNAMYINL